MARFLLRYRILAKIVLFAPQKFIFPMKNALFAHLLKIATLFH